MIIPPKYFLTPKISQLLSSIEACREVIQAISIPAEIERKIRRESNLKSSLFSAKIEGNPTTLEELPKIPSRDQKKVEVNNILRAINWIYERSARDITIKDILNLHAFVMKGLVEIYSLGKFRTGHEGIFTQAGFPVYHAPPPSYIPKLIGRLLKFVDSSKESFIPLKAFLSHFVFEKIHPFTDGSGRVGRLLILMILAKGGYGMKGILPLEEGINKRRETYYRMLEESERDVTSYLEFMLEVLNETCQETKKLILEKQKPDILDFLLPRRAEILRIIRDHGLVNFDMIRRRLAKVNERTLRYDLKKLAESGFIKKLGTTKGVYYKAAQIVDKKVVKVEY